MVRLFAHILERSGAGNYLLLPTILSVSFSQGALRMRLSLSAKLERPLLHHSAAARRI
jgi:hypothetical protein